MTNAPPTGTDEALLENKQAAAGPETAVEVPKASPEENAKATAGAGGVSKRPLLAVLAMIVVAAIIVAIAVPLASRNNDSTTTTDKTMNAQQNAAPDGSSSAKGGGNYTRVELLEALPMFTPDVLQGYATYFDFEQAVATAAMYMADEIINQNVQNLKQYEKDHNSGQGVDVSTVTTVSENTDDAAFAAGDAMAGNAMSESAAAPRPAEMSMAANTAQAAGSGSDAQKVTDFETNNQEQSVDEADVIKADANFVYAAYGDYILIWDTKGNKVAQVAMPVIPGFEDDQTDAPTVEATDSKTSSSNSYIPKARIRNLLITDNNLIVIVEGYGPDDYIYMLDNKDPPTRVLSDYKRTQIRLYQKTESGDLTFVGKKDVNGYYLDARSMGDNVHIATTSGMNIWSQLQQPLDPPTIFKAAGNDVAKTVENYEQLARDTLLNDILPSFSSQLRDEISQNGRDLPSLLQINQWRTNEPNATDVAPDDDNMAGNYHLIPDNVMNTFAQVTSFSAADPLNPSSLANDPELKISASAYFCPAAYGNLYGDEGHLVLATQSWNWYPRMRNSEETTYLVALKVNGPTTEFISVGSLEGTMLNQYAMDIVGNELRVATTVRNNTGWWGPRPMMMAEDAPVSTVMSMSTSSVATAASGSVASKSQCRTPATNDTCETEDSYNNCLKVEAGGCQTVAMSMNCPPSYFCVDDQMTAVPATMSPTFAPTAQESFTKNYMIVLEIESDAADGLMVEKGRVQVGEPNESITAVRFFDNIAYAVTFQRTDPFYVLNMSVPEILGEVKVAGFSSYLHPMNGDNTLLLAVGQNATDDGRVLGLMMTVFDSTDPANPKVLVSHTFENSADASSGSSVEFDYKAFRYLPSIGKVIIPVSIYYPTEYNPFTGEYDPVVKGQDNFDGFSVLNVNETAITEDFRVSHASPQGSCRYCDGGWLPTRSFVYDGNLMTVRDSLVISTSLDTGKEEWSLYLTVDGVPNDCCSR